ncbi:MAG: tetratricopeptide repeat protein [Woronichinia naegeliana WA131]|jgi:tetratricopeptide (TPR) repeat protein|uniref:Tetratricopeptide repeat protein n=1 Tax=Woronichinia naegeliana WA131 TaxID=2824559 RepID=A0A977PZ14_9CYAN|nr:MAG: tetratricopeptide repeat protein [Woronichinia naegeliana WA131]
MIATTIDWDQDVVSSKEESYQSLQNALNRNQGFGLYFVRSSPVQTQAIIEDIKRDLPNKNIGVLPLTYEVDNLFNLITNLPNYQNLNILFISGLELSLLRYEERESEGLFLLSQSAVYGGTWAGVPRILGHLNLSRERFREHFPFSIVFCLPEFALRYFIRRAPDFFDWRSGIYEFPLDQDTLSKELKEKLAELKAYLSDSPNLEKYKASELWFEMGLVFAMVGEQIKAISAFDRVLQFYPDEYNALYNKGVALEDLGRYEESITAYDNVLKMRPSDYEAWNSRGLALFNLDRYEEAIASYDNALKIKPDYHEAWYNRGNALGNLGRNEEAITSYDNALKFKSDKYKAWNHRGNALLVPMPYKKIALAIENLKGCDL